MDRNMTQGGIARTLVLFSLPLLLSGLLQQLYNWVDALIVGNYVGEAALAAVGATNVVSGMFIAIVSGFAVGVSIVVSQAFGEGDRPAVTRITATFTVFLGALSVILAAVGMLLARPLLRLLNTPGDILAGSNTYLSIIFLGLPAMAVYNIYNASLRGIGDSRTPLLAIAVSSAINLALDLLFVAVLGLGLAGAAWATVLSQILMVAFLIVYTPRRHPLLRFGLRGSVDRPSLQKGLSMSIPTSIQSGIRSVGGLLLQNIMNSFGSQTVAAITTAYRIDSLSLLPVINIGAGISTFVAQNKGAGDLRRAHRGLTIGAVLVSVTSLATTAVVVGFGGALMRLFGIGEGAVAIGREFLSICAIFYPIFALMNAFVGFLQGMGDVKFTAFAGISALAIRIGLSYLLAGTFGNRVIAYSEMASWVYQLLLCAARYAYVRKRWQ